MNMTYIIAPFSLSLGQARTLCPGVQSIPYDFDKYKEVA